MRVLKDLFESNRRWSQRMHGSDPDFFAQLSLQQNPEYLWIGCSDSRVPANEIVDLLPGTLFVHRNVANVVVHSDLNCLSVMQFAVDVLQVKHIMVVGHYGCGGVQAVMNGQRLGLVDNWLRHVRDVHDSHAAALAEIPDLEARTDRLCELNVIEQVAHVCQTSIVEDAWSRGQSLAVHGWVYGLRDGLLRDLDMCVTDAGELSERYRGAVTASVRLPQPAAGAAQAKG